MAFNPRLNLWQKILTVIGIVLLFGGFAALLFGEFSTSTGSAGLIHRGISGAGIMADGLGIICYIVIFVADIWNTRPRDAAERRTALAYGIRELRVVGLNLVIYGGCTLLALGTFAGLDGATPRHLIGATIIIVVCIAAIVLYRRYRKKHPFAYEYVPSRALLLFMFAIAVFMLFAGVSTTAEALADAIAGPKTVACQLSDFNEDEPSGRYRSFQATNLDLEFIDESGEIVSVSIKEQDRAVLSQIVDTGGNCYLTYYPHTKIFVQAQPLSSTPYL